MLPVSTALASVANTLLPRPFGTVAIVVGLLLAGASAVNAQVQRALDDRERRQWHRAGREILRQVGQADPRTALEMYRDVTPPYAPAAQAGTPVEGPAPPFAPTGDPAAGGTAAGGTTGAG